MKVNRSYSSLRQMIATHFQEPLLGLSEDDAFRLSYRSRVELLRVKDPAEKSRLARECLEKGWSTRVLAFHCKCARAGISPDAPEAATLLPSAFSLKPKTKCARIEYQMMKLCREIEDWHNAPDYDMDRLREAAILLNNALRPPVHARPSIPPRSAIALRGGEHSEFPIPHSSGPARRPLILPVHADTRPKIITSRTWLTPPLFSDDVAVRDLVRRGGVDLTPRKDPWEIEMERYWNRRD